MQKGRQLPLPPLIEAIADVDELEEMAEEFERRDGYAPELLSHWDPKPNFEHIISNWVPRQISDASIISYVYSSYLSIDAIVRNRISEGRERGLVLTQSGTTSIALVLTSGERRYSSPARPDAIIFRRRSAR